MEFDFIEGENMRDIAEFHSKKFVTHILVYMYAGRQGHSRPDKKSQKNLPFRLTFKWNYGSSKVQNNAFFEY